VTKETGPAPTPARSDSLCPAAAVNVASDDCTSTAARAACRAARSRSGSAGTGQTARRASPANFTTSPPWPATTSMIRPK
jgi:hypothetical protein